VSRIVAARTPPSGTNLVLFNPSVADIGASRLVDIMDTRVQYRDPEPE